MSNSDLEIVAHYHSPCYKSYTAVKRPREHFSAFKEQSHAAKIARTITRQSGVLPKSDDQGLLKGSCIFCGKAPKKKNGIEEPRLKIQTFSGCSRLSERALTSKHERIKSFIMSGVDLIAKEA